MKTIDTFKDRYAILSNFNGNIPNGKTVEHHYQAAKTIIWKWQLDILTADTPGKAKKLGRKVPLRDDWELIKVDVMRELLIRKFSIEYHKTILLSTDDQELIEGNYWHDNFWGVCNCGKCSNGQNNLGKLLMELREEIRFDF